MSEIFKAYDIRGKYPDDLNDELALNIGRAFGEFIGSGTIVVGRDMRPSSTPLFENLAKGITEMGLNVVDIGMCSTDLMYFSVEEGNYDGGIMITASHNPKEYNGMKMVREHGIPLNKDTGIGKIKEMVQRGNFQPADTPGTISENSFLDAYVKNVFDFVDPKSIKKFKVAMDAGNGVAGVVIPHIFKHLDIEMIEMYFEPDGDFPNHPANPLEAENRVDLVNKVKETGADIGIAWDGDMDRCFFIDENGDFIPGDFMTALISKTILAKDPDNTILYDLRSTKAVPDTVKEMGGKALETRVGHAFIKQYMREEDSIFAGEVSGHYYFRMGELYAENGMIPPLMVLELMTKEKKKLSELTGFPGYVLSGEINSKVDDVATKLQLLEEKYSDAKIHKLDGITIEYDDWWFNVRKSNTEPLLRLCLEAKTQEMMEEKRDEVLGIIRG